MSRDPAEAEVQGEAAVMKRNNGLSGLKNTRVPLEKFSRINKGLRKKGEVEERNGNPLL